MTGALSRIPVEKLVLASGLVKPQFSGGSMAVAEKSDLIPNPPSWQTQARQSIAPTRRDDVTRRMDFSFRSFSGYCCDMSATLTGSTVLAGEPNRWMADLLVALRAHGRPALVAGDGTHIELPDELYEVMKDAAAALSQGLAAGPRRWA
jgi:hypothetical protein